MLSFDEDKIIQIWPHSCNLAIMKQLLLSFMLLAFLSCTQEKPTENQTVVDTVVDKSHADTASIMTPVLPKKSEDPIEDIRKIVERINTVQLDSKHYEFTCDEKVKVDYFYDKGTIVKISVDFGTVGDVYAKEDYYYNEGKLIFKYEFVEGGPACEGCIKTNEYRSYVVDDKVLKYLKNNKVENCRQCEFKQTSRYYKLLQPISQAQMKSILCPGL